MTTDNKQYFNSFYCYESFSMVSVKLCDYESTVGGYHYYRKYWQLQVQQKLKCCYEKGNPYGFYAINVADISSAMIVRHLPMKNLMQITAYLGRLRNTVPHWNSYAFKNKELARIYGTLDDTLYYQRKETSTVCSFIENNMEIKSNERKE